jgi:hypothetical protein
VGAYLFRLSPVLRARPAFVRVIFDHENSQQIWQSLTVASEERGGTVIAFRPTNGRQAPKERSDLTRHRHPLTTPDEPTTPRPVAPTTTASKRRDRRDLED